MENDPASNELINSSEKTTETPVDPDPAEDLSVLTPIQNK
jgi:hypothetical protein